MTRALACVGYLWPSCVTSVSRKTIMNHLSKINK
jgi:hypothetical protein